MYVSYVPPLPPPCQHVSQSCTWLSNHLCCNAHWKEMPTGNLCWWLSTELPLPYEKFTTVSEAAPISGIVGVTATLAVKCWEVKHSCCNWWWCCCAIWCKTKEEKAATIIWWYIWWYTRLYCQYIMVKACFPLFPCLCLGQMYMPENNAFTWVIEVNIEQSVFLTVPAFHLDMSWSNVSAIKGALLSV